MRLVDWLQRRRRDDDLLEEIQSHLTMAARDRAESGESPDRAWQAAHREFGNVTLTRDATRLSWGGLWRERLVHFAHDVRYSARVLRKSPGYALIVTAVLALGIGANAAVFSLFKSLALKPLSGVDDGARLAVVVARTSAGRIVPLSHPDFRDIQAESRAFAGLAGTVSSAFSVGLGADSRRAQGEAVTGNYFQVLQVGVQRGRAIQPSDDAAPGQSPVVVISDRMWRQTFDSDPDIVGRTIRVNAKPLTIIGVAAPDFHGTIVSWVIDLFIPMSMQPELQEENLLTARRTPLMWGLGRLGAGVSLAAADQEVGLLAQRLAALQTEPPLDQRATVIPLWQSPFGAQTYFLPLVAMLSVMSALLLLIVCANVSNLLLVRGISRRGEIAARFALGATRLRILRLLLVESLILAIPGTALGLLVARGIMILIDLNRLAARAGSPITILLDTSLDWTVVAFATALACGSLLVFALVPALRSSRIDLAGIMKDDLSPRGGSRGRMRGVLVVSQVAVSLVLLVCTGLVLRSLKAAEVADTGFDANRVALVGLNLRPAGYAEGAGRSFYQRLLESARGDANVESATLTTELPLQFVDNETNSMAIEGYTARSGDDMQVKANVIAPDYFKTLQIPLVTGRDFVQTDGPNALPVAIVNETMARRFWGTPEQAIGKRVQIALGTAADQGGWRTVVGVARDIKYVLLNEALRPYAYLPFDQAYRPDINLLVRARTASSDGVARGRAIVAGLDANLPTHGARMLREVTGIALTIFNMAASVLLVFGLVALTLTALGTYGLVSYAARQSTHEVGVRLAIGAARTTIVRQFLRQGLWLGAIGAIGGIAAAAALTRVVASLLYGVSATDGVSFTAAFAAVLTIVALASLIPAWRASQTDPLVALRQR